MRVFIGRCADGLTGDPERRIADDEECPFEAMPIPFDLNLEKWRIGWDKSRKNKEGRKNTYRRKLAIAELKYVKIPTQEYNIKYWNPVQNIGINVSAFHATLGG